MSHKCKDNQIINPTTKRCVNIGGPIGKKVLQDHKNGTIILDAADVQKLQALGLLNSTKAASSSSQPENVQFFINEEHANYCKQPNAKRDPTKLSAPIETTTIKQILFIEKIIVPNLPNKKNKQIVKDLFNNFDIRIFQKRIMSRVFLEYPYSNYHNHTQPVSILNQYNMKSIKTGIPYIDMPWAQDVLAYISNLPFDQMYTILGFQECFNKQKMSTSWSLQLTERLSPYFFSALKHIKQYQKSDLSQLLQKNEVDLSFRSYYGDTCKNILKKETALDLLEELYDSTEDDSIKYGLYITIYQNFTEKFWTDVLIAYQFDVNAIIHGAPKLTKQLIVYIHNDPKVISNVKKDYTVIQTAQAYISVKNVNDSKNKINSKSFIKITLQPGTPAFLCLGYYEPDFPLAVIIPRWTKFKLKNTRSIPKPSAETLGNWICPSVQDVTVYELE
jgi:hypothetical protein